MPRRLGLRRHPRHDPRRPGTPSPSLALSRRKTWLIFRSWTKRRSGKRPASLTPRQLPARRGSRPRPVPCRSLRSITPKVTAGLAAGYPRDRDLSAIWRKRRLSRSTAASGGQAASSVKPSAQPTLVRTQHLPPVTTPGQRIASDLCRSRGWCSPLRCRRCRAMPAWPPAVWRRRSSGCGPSRGRRHRDRRRDSRCRGGRAGPDRRVPGQGLPGASWRWHTVACSRSCGQ